MRELILTGRDALRTFSYALTGISLLVPCFFWLCFCDQDKAKKNGLDMRTTRGIVILPLIVLAALFGPVSSYLIGRLIGAQAVSDCFIAVPTAVIVGYTVVHLLDYLRLPAKKELGMLLALVFIMIASVSLPMRFSLDGYRFPANAAKIDREVYEIEDIVGDRPVVLPERIRGQVGEIYCDLKPIYVKGTPERPYDETDYRRVINAGLRNGKAPLVIHKRWDNKKKYESYHYHEKARAGDYIVYEYTP